MVSCYHGILEDQSSSRRSPGGQQNPEAELESKREMLEGQLVPCVGAVDQFPKSLGSVVALQTSFHDLRPALAVRQLA
ncbi:hypothetical protein LIER_04102 [Lithospermum erythrorhizon]|uniref:Uncharacterized protein n=1 Tax=Lithospermum erythrorhizon TaxID=34254 RepID=A0AAV3NVI2_LITER